MKGIELGPFSLQWRAGDALGKIRAESAVPGPVALLGHESWNVKCKAARALALMDHYDRDAEAILIELSKTSRHENVRIESAELARRMAGR